LALRGIYTPVAPFEQLLATVLNGQLNIETTVRFTQSISYFVKKQNNYMGVNIHDKN